MIDDFREAYWWLRDNTPEDARVLSWWDYGGYFVFVFVFVIVLCFGFSVFVL